MLTQALRPGLTCAAPLALASKMAPMKGRRYEAKGKMPAKVRGRYIGKVKGKMAPMKGRRYKAKAKMPAKVRGPYIGKVKGKMAPMKGRRYEARHPKMAPVKGRRYKGSHFFRKACWASQSEKRSIQWSVGRFCLCIPKPWPPLAYMWSSADLWAAVHFSYKAMLAGASPS